MLRLSETQINQYFTEGYLHIPAVYTVAEVQACRDLIEADLANGDWLAAPHATETVTTDIYERIPALTDIVFNDNYVSCVKQLFGPEPVLIAEPAIHKSRYFYWHKDSTFISEQAEDYHLSKEFQAAMTVMYLQENHPNYGGGISLIPGSQWTDDWFATIPNMSLAERAILKAKKMLGVSKFDYLDRSEKLLPIPTAVGDVLFLDMRLDHKGTPRIKESPTTKYGIMNIACRGSETARKLQRTLRNRPGDYYQVYLKNQPDTTPKLREIAETHGLEVIV